MLEVVCGIIEDRSGRFLACRRPAGKHLGGLWEFPGGKVDPGETPRSALARELHEELGVEVDVGEALQPVVWDYGTTVIQLRPFRCVVRCGEPHPHEHEDIRWCRTDDWESLAWAAADLPILEELRGKEVKRFVDSTDDPAIVPES